MQTCDNQCPVQLCSQIIEHKWSTLVIRELLSGPKRYYEIQAGLLGISNKVLSQRLRLLQKQGMIERTVFATVPPTTEYRLSPLGAQLEHVIMPMAVFGEQLKHNHSPSAKQAASQAMGV